MKNRKANIAVFVSGGGTNLQALINASENAKMPHVRLSLVVSNRSDAYALKRAEKAGIPSLIIEKNHDPIEFENKLIAAVEENGIDLIVLAGFMSILSERFTSLYPERIINVHPSLIPAFCGKGFYGLRVHSDALDYGVKVTGATVHFVNEIPDGGRIILQKAVLIKDGDTPEILQRRVMEQAEWKILPRAVEIVSKEIVKNECL